MRQDLADERRKCGELRADIHSFRAKVADSTQHAQVDETEASDRTALKRYREAISDGAAVGALRAQNPKIATNHYQSCLLLGILN